MADFNNLIPPTQNLEDQQQGNEDPEYQQLKLWWQQEKSCPEILPFDAEIIGYHLELLAHQESVVAALDDDDDDDDNHQQLVQSLYCIEMSRVRFLVTDLLRCRMNKMESHPFYYCNITEEESMSLFGDGEREYLKQYRKLLDHHLSRSVLQHLPKPFQSYEPEMVNTDSYDDKEFVFCQIVSEEGVEIHHEEEDEEDAMLHQAGASLIVRYEVIRDYVHQGKVVLLL